MKRYITLILIYLIAGTGLLFSQKEAYNWICGDSLGLNFNTPDLYPVSLEKPINRYRNCPYDYYFYFVPNLATVSDAKGNYLLTSYGGIDIWNKNNDIIHSYADLNFDSAQYENYWDNWWFNSNYILKMPGSANLFYNVFTRREIVRGNHYGATQIENSSEYYYYSSPAYHIIDMNMNGGSGGMKKTDVFFYHRNAKLLPICHANGNDIWIVVFQKDTNYVFSYLLNQNGLDTTKRVSSKTSSMLYYLVDYCLKSSPQGNLIAYYDQGRKGVVVLGFNRKTGEIGDVNYVLLCNLGLYDYVNSLEFSPDGTKLYCRVHYFQSDKMQKSLIQFDLDSAGKATTLDVCFDKKCSLSSKCFDYNNKLQLGPGGRIYVLDVEDGSDYQSVYNYSRISVIDHPNESGTACSFKKDILITNKYIPKENLYGKAKFFTFPNIYARYAYVEIKATATTPVCEGDTLFLFSRTDTSLSSIKYEWSGPGGFTSTQQNPVIPNARPSMSGCYKVKYKSDNFTGSDTVIITINPKPKTDITGDTRICTGTTTYLKANTINNKFKYHWSTGDTTNIIAVKDSGKYSVVVTDENGCSNSTETHVTLYDYPKISIIGTREICHGNPVKLTTTSNIYVHNFRWSTGDTTFEISVNKPGTYQVIAESEIGCRDTASITLYDMAKAQIVIKGLPCAEAKPVLKALPDTTGYEYLWSTGEKSSEITVSAPGYYTLIVTSSYGCKDTTQAYIYPSPEVNIEGFITLCKGDEASLRTDKEFSSYIWSTGDTTREIRIINGGTYTVTVTDTIGCSSTASFNVKDIQTVLSAVTDLDFGRLCTGEKAEREVIIKNEGNLETIIKKVYCKNNVSAFSVIPEQTVLQPGEETKVKAAFNPHIIGNYKDTIIIEVSEPCPVTYIAEIKGTGMAKTIASLPNTSAYVYQSLNIPMGLMLICGESLPPDAKYSAEIQFDATVLLLPPSLNPNIQDLGIRDGKRILSLAGDGLETKSFTGTMLLAGQDTTKLRIEKLIWNYDLIDNEVTDGSIALTGVCRQNFSRVEMADFLTMSLYPNPAASEAEIKIEGAKNGNIEINIYSMEGIKVETFSIDKSAWDVSHKINLKEYNAGIYQIVASDGSDVLVDRMVVIK